jgi:ElaB/YqjD/DUF883 family membrane-anchored ribosome-binding protein
MSAPAHTQSSTRHHNGRLSSVGDELADLKESVSTGVQDAAEGGKRVLRAATSAAARTASSVRKSAVQARDRVGQTISERPFTSVAIAAGVGALIGAALLSRRN